MANLQLKPRFTEIELKQYLNQEFPQFLTGLYDVLMNDECDTDLSFKASTVIDQVNEHVIIMLYNLGVFDVIKK